MKNNILKSIFISLILLVGATNTWAASTVNGGHIYFDELNSGYTGAGDMQFWVGHNNYSSSYSMSKVTNTKLWYCSAPSWGDATYFAFTSGANWGAAGQKYYDRIGSNPWKSAIKQSYTLNGGSYYVFKVASTANKAAVSSDSPYGHQGNAYSSLNKTITIKAKISTDGGSSYKEANTPAKLAGSSKVFTSESSCAGTDGASATLNAGSASTTFKAGYTANTTLTAVAATGYTFTGWHTDSKVSSDLQPTVNPTGATTYYAYYKAHKYTVKFNANGGTGTMSDQASVYGVSQALTANSFTRTGYNFAGWNTKADGTGTSYTDKKSVSNLTATDGGSVTLYAQWTAKDITINWNANGGSVTPTSSTYTYDGAAITLPTPSYAGHRFLGWFTAADGGTQITNVGTTNKPYTTVTYYAHWEVSIEEHTVTFAVGTGSTEYGTLTAATKSGNITSGSNVVEGTSVTFTATPNTGYEVEGWYTNAACTEGKHDAGQTTYTTSITGITNVYVKFVEKTWSVTFVAGTGGAIAEPASSPKTVGEVTGVTIIAKASTGYTFSGWTSSKGGKFDDSKSEKATFKPTAATTVTANFDENLYAITVKSNNESFGTVSPESGTAGIDTKFTIIATPKLGYKFVSWKTDAGITVADSESQETTVNATAAGTITANFELIPPTTIYIKSNGSYADFKWNYNSVAYGMTPMDCAGTYYTANVLGGIDEITLTGSNNSFTTTNLTVPTDGKTLYDLTSTKITHLYLAPNANWKSDKARFAVALMNSDKTTTEWVSMTNLGNDIYSCAIPDGTWKYVIFCRMNPNAAANNWNNKWNQTGDLEIPTNGTNKCAINSGQWDCGENVTWSTVWDNSRWTTFDAPKLDVKINITGKGSIVIDDETYTSITTGKESFAFTKTSGDSITVGAITPADRWALTSSQITMCDNTEDLAASHTINGPATINLSFTQTSCEVVFNLNLPRGTEHPLIPAQYVAVGEKATQPTLNEINDYIFGGWYSDKNCTQAYNFENSVTTDITIHAKWVLHSQCIFFKNTLSWSDVYIYTFTDNAYWNDGTGVRPGTNKLEQGKMTQLDKTDIYYYILTDLTGFCHIAFSDYDMRGYELFNDHKAIYRSDRSDLMPLFIPEKDQTPTGDTYTTNKYYSSGIWMKYNSTESGYKWSSDKNGWSTDVNPFTASTKGGYTFTTTVTLEGNTEYLFKINNIKNNWFGNTGTMTQDNCTKWHFTPDTDNATIQPNVTGDYVFTVYLGDGKVELSLEYPLSVEDYRLSYYDAKTGFHPGHYIKNRGENRLDTVSFFIHTENNPELRLEKCINIDANTSTATWDLLKTYPVLKTSGADPATAMLPGKRKSDGTLYIGEGCGIDSTGVYNFVLQQTSTTVDLQTDYTHPYVGDFYIRTDAAPGGWDSFRQAGNKITYSSFADEHSDFNHYFCKWILAGGNVKFTIGNDYSYCISDTLDGDDVIGTTGEHIGYLPADANVRFGWDNETNKITRAYIKGAGKKQDRFLVLQGNEHLKDIENKRFEQDGNIKVNEVVFDDMGNWIYQIDVTANKDTRIKLTALYNGKTQYFKGTEDSVETILSDNASANYKLRMIYDFKSNHLICGWIANGDDVSGEQTLGADMLVIRENQDPASQIDFNKNNKKLDEVGKAYAVMTFTNQFVNNLEQPEHARAHYWISFPFDVKISEIFGFGEYGNQWILQLYDGAARAKEGYWAESEGFWRYITNKGYTLKKGVGYVLTLNLKKMKPGTVFENTDEVSLYFPSTNEINVIQEDTNLITNVPAHECTIERDNRKIYDSHWNIIGVPGFVDISNYSTAEPIINPDQAKDGGPSFYYEYLFATNTYQAEVTTNTFQTMYGYMVQYTGDLIWSTTTSTPEPIAARRISDASPEMVTLRLELAQGEDMEDQTFVQLQQEGATAEFDMNVDMTKIINSGANIYTLVGTDRIQTAGNVLPFEETTVAVGVDIATAGEYTFRMPDGTEGMVVELIDYEANTTTNLLLDDYTVNLPAGSNETRFALSLKPEKTATSIESTTTPSDSNIRKFIIDGKLYLQKDGMLYDAQGKLVR